MQTSRTRKKRKGNELDFDLDQDLEDQNERRLQLQSEEQQTLPDEPTMTAAPAVLSSTFCEATGFPSFIDADSLEVNSSLFDGDDVDMEMFVSSFKELQSLQSSNGHALLEDEEEEEEEEIGWAFFWWVPPTYKSTVRPSFARRNAITSHTVSERQECDDKQKLSDWTGMKWNKKLCCLQTSLALPFATDFRVEAGGGGAGASRMAPFSFHFWSYFHSNCGTHLLFPKGTVNLSFFFFFFFFLPLVISFVVSKQRPQV